MALWLESTLETLTEAHKQINGMVISKDKLRGSEKAVNTLLSIHEHVSPGRSMKMNPSGLANYIFWINLYNSNKPFHIINMSWHNARAHYAPSKSHIS